MRSYGDAAHAYFPNDVALLYLLQEVHVYLGEMAIEDIYLLIMVFLFQLNDHQLTVEANPLPIDGSIICASRNDSAPGRSDDGGAKGVGKVSAVVDAVSASSGGAVRVETGRFVVVSRTEGTVQPVVILRFDDRWRGGECGRRQWGDGGSACGGGS